MNPQYKEICAPFEIAIGDLPAQPFFVIVTADFAAIDVEAMEVLAEKLIDGKAMWVAAHGNAGTLFDDVVDEVFVLRTLDRGDTLPRVMTTWHDEEMLEEVIAFLQSVTPHEGWGVLQDWPLLILTITPSP